MITTLTGKQNHLEETSKIYTGNHKDRKNSWEYYKFIFLLIIYVFLAWDATCLEYSYSTNLYAEICYLIVTVERNCITSIFFFFFFCQDNIGLGFSVSFRPVILQQGRFCPLGNVWQCLGHFGLARLEYALLSFSGWRPGLLLSVLQGAGQPPTPRNFSAPMSTVLRLTKPTLDHK